MADSTVAKASTCCDSDPEPSKRVRQNVDRAEQQQKQNSRYENRVVSPERFLWRNRRESTHKLPESRHNCRGNTKAAEQGEDSKGFWYLGFLFFPFRYLGLLVLRCFGKKVVYKPKRRRFPACPPAQHGVVLKETRQYVDETQNDVVLVRAAAGRGVTSGNENDAVLGMYGILT